MSAVRPTRRPSGRLALLVLATALLVAVPTVVAGTSAPSDAAPPSRSTFVDDFNGRSLDTTKWTAGDTATNWSGIGTGTCHLADNVRVANGYLHLTSTVTAKPFACRYPTGDTFRTRGASAEVHTKGKFSQTYGSWQIRARFAADQTYNASALWMYPDEETYGAWPRSGEIDIIERMPWSNQHAYASVHYLDESGGTSFDPSDGDGNPGETATCEVDVTQWHVYGMTWDRKQISFTIDGTVCSTMGWTPKDLRNPAPFDQPFFTILRQTAVVSDAPVDQTRTMVVDWVRVES